MQERVQLILPKAHLVRLRLGRHCIIPLISEMPQTYGPQLACPMLPNMPAAPVTTTQAPTTSTPLPTTEVPTTTTAAPATTAAPPATTEAPSTTALPATTGEVYSVQQSFRCLTGHVNEQHCLSDSSQAVWSLLLVPCCMQT